VTGPLLAIEAVDKSFGRTRALSGIVLAVEAGEKVALLGHNGAGKTTLFRLVLGFLRPDTGRLTVAGAPPGAAAARRVVAYLPENVAFPKALTGREIIDLYATLKGARRDEAGAALARVGLDHAAGRRCGTYSKGMRQRLGLAQALVGRPRLMLLDEPTSGLDPQSRRDFYELVDEIAAAGTAVILSSHSLEELEARTDRVAILNEGRLVADAPLAELQARAGLPIRMRVRARDDALGEVKGRLGGREVNGQSIEFDCPVADKLERLAAISALGTLVRDVDIEPPGLDDVYSYFSTHDRTEQPT